MTEADGPGRGECVHTTDKVRHEEDQNRKGSDRTNTDREPGVQAATFPAGKRKR